MSLPNVFESWIFNGIAILAAIMCLVWATMLIGALAASLEKPPAYVKRFALKEVYASAIMKSMTRELVAIVAAIALIAIATINQLSMVNTYEKMAANFLSTYRPYSSGRSVIDGFRLLSQLPGRLQNTLAAYHAYEENPAFPNVEGIEWRLPEADRNVFDLRLLGIAHSSLIAQKAPAARANSAEKSLGYLEKARKKAEAGDIPGNPDPESKAMLVVLIEHTIAGITIQQIEADMEYGKKTALTDSQAKQLQESIRVLDRHRISPGTIPQTYFNLLICYSLTGDYDQGLKVLDEIAEWQAPLNDYDRKELLKWLIGLDQSPLHKRLVTHFEKNRKTSWKTFLQDTLFSKRGA